jgi:hypothetical protein
MLALVASVQKWRPYLLGQQFVVRTDHRSLKYLWDQTIVTEAQQKWLVKLVGYDFIIEYKKGSENSVADALSRQGEGSLIAISQPVPQWVEPIQHEVQSEPLLRELVEKIQAGDMQGPWHVHSGVIYFKNRIYLASTSALTPTIIAEFHNATHEGYNKTLQRLRAVFYWPGMSSQLKEFIKHCDTCQRHKTEATKPAGLLQPLPIPEQVWSNISMDFIDGLPPSNGKTTILVVVDRFSKYGHFTPIKQWVFWRELFRLNGTSFRFSSAYHPQTDGQTEVVNRTIEMYLRCFTSSYPKQWVKWLPWVEFCYNTSFHSATKHSPFEVVYGRPPPSLLSYIPGTTQVAAVEGTLVARDAVLREVRRQLMGAQNRMKQVYDKDHTEREFCPGEWVYLRLHNYRQQSLSKRTNQKLAPRFFGPYRITAKIGPVAYRLALPPSSKIHNVFHVSVLKKWLGTGTPVQDHLPVGEDEPVFPQAVLDRRIQQGVHQILVHWQGYSPADATWESLSDFQQRFLAFVLEDKDVSKGEGVLRVPHTKEAKKESRGLHGKINHGKESRGLHIMAKKESG